MGSSYTKDEAIILYMNTNKQYYVAGDYVEGQVYLSAKTNRQYSNLNLRIQGIQYVYWITGSGKNTRHHSNTYKSYDAYNLLVDFHGVVKQGQYMFPFTMLLPTMMSGSFYHSSHCYIKYSLIVELTHPTEEKQSQRYEMFLNILQPPRFALGPSSLTNTFNSQCCGCCTNYGNIQVTLNSSHNFVHNGDNIQISGQVNNSQGKTKIKSWQIVLQQHRKMVSNYGQIRDVIEAQYPLYPNGGQVYEGQVQQFNFSATIPAQILSYTAIGRVTARYFLLHLYTDYGCCTDNAEAVLHLIVHSRTPMIVQKKVLPVPSNWSPQVYPKLTIQNLKPYLYSPLPQIDFLNMPGNQNIVMNTAPDAYKQSMMGYQLSDVKIPNIEPQNYSYNPTYYNQDMFSDVQKMQQGYKQPYFANQTSEANLIRKL